MHLKILGYTLDDDVMAAAISHTDDESFALVAGKSLALMRHGHMVPLVLSAP